MTAWLIALDFLISAISRIQVTAFNELARVLQASFLPVLLYTYLSNIRINCSWIWKNLLKKPNTFLVNYLELLHASSVLQCTKVHREQNNVGHKDCDNIITDLKLKTNKKKNIYKINLPIRQPFLVKSYIASPPSYHFRLSGYCWISCSLCASFSTLSSGARTWS